jgi:hypothetical protein
LDRRETVKDFEPIGSTDEILDAVRSGIPVYYLRAGKKTPSLLEKPRLEHKIIRAMIDRGMGPYEYFPLLKPERFFKASEEKKRGMKRRIRRHLKRKIKGRRMTRLVLRKLREG